jgi:hypothetical protein
MLKDIVSADLFTIKPNFSKPKTTRGRNLRFKATATNNGKPVDIYLCDISKKDKRAVICFGNDDFGLETDDYTVEYDFSVGGLVLKRLEKV